MKSQSLVLEGPQKIDIFSKRKPAIRVTWSYFFIILFCIFSGIFAVWQRVQYIRTGNEIQLLQQDHENLLQEQRKLLLEYHMSISLDKVEDRAREKLKMGDPQPNQVLYVK